MKVAVLGAGAIGAFVGTALARGGAEVHLIARGAHLEAMPEAARSGRGCCALPDLGAPTREGDAGICVCEFQDRFSMGQSKVSYHMRKLKDASLILEEKRGKWSFYSLDREAVRDLLGEVAEHLGVAPPSLKLELPSLTVPECVKRFQRPSPSETLMRRRPGEYQVQYVPDEHNGQPQDEQNHDHPLAGESPQQQRP